jgi:L-seryl-tRNA(Ser) seleniumtransferase
MRATKHAVGEESSSLVPGEGLGHDAPVPATSTRNLRRDIPSLERLLQAPAGVALASRYRRDHVVETARAVLDELRHAAAVGEPVPADDAVLARVAERLSAGRRLQRVINATGVVLHTNLGRAVLAESAVAALTDAARHAVDLELDLATGRRGRRDDLVVDDLRALTGAEDALVVNNNAAGVLLVLHTLARGREVIVSRGELVEIGGSFRMPDVMAASGARLREVGTTNRTHPDDFRRAVGPETALLMKVHPSNYRMVGFTAAVDLRELVAIGREADVPVVDDVGSGALVDLAEYGLPAEPIVRERIAAGADLVMFSADKLLGGPQAGLVVGRPDLIAALRASPMRRALRADKLRLAALAATLRLYRETPDLSVVLPTLRWLTRPLAEMERVGQAAVPLLSGALGAGYLVTMVASEAEVGSGSVPARSLESRALAVEHAAVSPDAIAARFRAARPAVLGRIHDGRFLLDLRGIFDAQDLAVALD